MSLSAAASKHATGVLVSRSNDTTLIPRSLLLCCCSPRPSPHLLHLCTRGKSIRHRRCVVTAPQRHAANHRNQSNVTMKTHQFMMDLKSATNPPSCFTTPARRQNRTFVRSYPRTCPNYHCPQSHSPIRARSIIYTPAHKRPNI